MSKLIKIFLFLIAFFVAGYFFGGITPDKNEPRGIHTTKDLHIEQREDQLSRAERIERLFHFKEAVEEAMDKRVPKDDRVTAQEISPLLKDAIIATEDKRFYEHSAIDTIGMARAIYINLEAGQTLEGASTISQQLVKNLFLSSKRILSRKAEEIILAFLLEYYYTKDEILTMYLNTIYYGNDYYGIKQATEGYFNTSPKDLNLGQAALLAGIPQAPSYYNPESNFKASKERQKTVLRLMVEQDFITSKEADKAYYMRLKSPNKADI